MDAYNIFVTNNIQNKEEAWRNKVGSTLEHFLNTLPTKGYKRIDNKPEDWHERFEHGDFDDFSY